MSGCECENELWSVADCMVGRLSSLQVLSGERAEERARAEDTQASRHPTEGAQTPREHSEGKATLKETLILVPLLCNTKCVFFFFFYQQYTPESPSGKRENSQLIPGAEDKSSLSSSLYVHFLKKSTFKGNQQWSCIFFHVSLFLFSFLFKVPVTS